MTQSNSQSRQQAGISKPTAVDLAGCKGRKSNWEQMETDIREAQTPRSLLLLLQNLLKMHYYEDIRTTFDEYAYEDAGCGERWPVLTCDARTPWSSFAIHETTGMHERDDKSLGVFEFQLPRLKEGLEIPKRLISLVPALAPRERSEAMHHGHFAHSVTATKTWPFPLRTGSRVNQERDVTSPIGISCDAIWQVVNQLPNKSMAVVVTRLEGSRSNTGTRTLMGGLEDRVPACGSSSIEELPPVLHTVLQSYLDLSGLPTATLRL
ncbi:hypothetical protein BKA93DRAFT_746331 [Sparassis latifolia]